MANLKSLWVLNSGFILDVLPFFRFSVKADFSGSESCPPLHLGKNCYNVREFFWAFFTIITLPLTYLSLLCLNQLQWSAQQVPWER